MPRQDEIRLDGAEGEGGGQIVRTALTCSMLTGQAFRLENVRANRPTPGLKAQHLEAVRAAAEQVDAVVEGDRIGGEHLSFRPRTAVVGGSELDVRIGTAGATALVVQTLLLPLAFASSSSTNGAEVAPQRARVRGGTHVAFAPSIHYLDEVFRHACEAFGLQFRLDLRRPGFFPKGGGDVMLEVVPLTPPATVTQSKPGLVGIDWRKRGALRDARVIIFSAGLQDRIVRRAANAVTGSLVGAQTPWLQSVRPHSIDGGASSNPGGVVLAVARWAKGAAGFQALAERGVPAERLGQQPAEALRQFVEPRADDPHGDSSKSLPTVDAKLADQLLLLAALAHGESAFRTERVTQHLLTNASVLRRFLMCKIEIEGGDNDRHVLVHVVGTGYSAPSHRA